MSHDVRLQWVGTSGTRLNVTQQEVLDEVPHGSLHSHVGVTAVHTEDGVKSERDGDKTRQIKGLTEGTERKKKGGGRVGWWLGGDVVSEAQTQLEVHSFIPLSADRNITCLSSLMEGLLSARCSLL